MMTTKKIKEIVDKKDFVNKLKTVSDGKWFLTNADRAILLKLRTQPLKFWSKDGEIIVKLSHKVDIMIQKLFGIHLKTLKTKEEVEDMAKEIQKKQGEFIDEVPNFNEIIATLSFIGNYS